MADFSLIKTLENLMKSLEIISKIGQSDEMILQYIDITTIIITTIITTTRYSTNTWWSTNIIFYGFSLLITWTVQINKKVHTKTYFSIIYTYNHDQRMEHLEDVSRVQLGFSHARFWAYFQGW